MLQNHQITHAPVAPSPEALPAASAKTIRIDLVKSEKLGLTLKQAAALSIVHQLISKRGVPSAEIDADRWWYIDGQTIHEFSEAVAPHPHTGTQHLLALHQKKLIEVDELDTCVGVKAVLRIRTNVLLLEDDA